MDEEIYKNIDKYDKRLNKKLCLEEDEYGVFICDNKVIPDEDLCYLHNEEQKSITYEYYDYIINDILYIERKFMTEYIQNIYFQYVVDICLIENTLTTIDKYKEREIFYNNKYKKDNISFKFFEKGSIRYTWYNGKITGETHQIGNPFHCDDCNKTENINDYKLGSLVNFYCKKCVVENVNIFIEFNKKMKT